MKLIAKLAGVALVAATLGPAGVAFAQVKVGVVVSTTGPGAVLGIPYRNVFDILPNEIAGEPVEYIVLDDASDMTTGVRNAKRLIDENMVDIVIGSNSVPT